ncbi:hypothetical protein [Geomonas sp.]|uniref:hypothetical protein n=1 Tax=Geomonas sp. TaxID=2651584 RepID=UPI002B48209B|nr:hypothetical protein [Geomonas sp.]HJV35903.1 hypothetical protein [Geomonas sp.]
MIYLTNDALDQAVYFDLRSREPHRKGRLVEQVYSGLLGNGVHEVDVTLKKRRGTLEVAFGKSELFRFIEEDDLRRLLGEALKGNTMH